MEEPRSSCEMGAIEPPQNSFCSSGLSSASVVPFPLLTEEQLQTMTPPMLPATPPPPASRLLFFTNSDAGQANPVIAVASEILLAAPDVEVHLAGDAALIPRANSAFADAAFLFPSTTRRFASGELMTQRQKSRPQRPVVMHSMEHSSMWTAGSRPEIGMREAYDRTPGTVNSARGMARMPGIVQPWTADEYASIYAECKHIIERVRPDYIVVEPLFSPAITLLAHTKTNNWCLLCPNTIKDFAALEQPKKAALWKYPIMTSGYDYPIPWYRVPSNVFLNVLCLGVFKTTSHFSAPLKAIRESHEPDLEHLTTAKDLGVLARPPPGLRIIVASHSMLDHAGLRVPDYMLPVGPIVRAASPVHLSDYVVDNFIRNGPTVLVNLGTQMRVTATEAIEMAHALRAMFDAACECGYNDLQVLWKLSKKHEFPVGHKPGQHQNYSSTGEEAASFGEVRSRLEMHEVMNQYELSEGHTVTWSRHYGQWAEIDKILEHEMADGRVMLARWLVAEPKAILESESVVASVHHGGASSFNEAIVTGVPQVVLPIWADCYDFAARAANLGVGVWANRGAKPRWHRAELAAALVRVVLDEDEAPRIKAACRELALHFPERAGRERAAQEILSGMAGVASGAL